MSEPTNASHDEVRSSELDLGGIEARYLAALHDADTTHLRSSRTILALVAEVRRLRAALEVIAGDDLDYFGRLRLTDAEDAVYVIARDALGRSDEPSPS